MTKLVCFDLDDTIVRGIHSVMFLCLLNGSSDEMPAIEKLENDGILHWIEADHHKARLIRGLSEGRLREEFDSVMKPLGGVGETIEALKKQDIRSILVTAGPRQVARVAAEKWAFDASYGSDYETVDGVFTGMITEHIGDRGKIQCLMEFCRKHNIDPETCVAVGDGSTDIPLFEFCGKSIALNASRRAIDKATWALRTDDLRDILPFILHSADV